MINYFSTFPSGLQEVVVKALKRNLDGARVTLLLDGVVIYETSQMPEKIASLRFFQNSFLLLFSLDSFKGKVEFLTLSVLKNKEQIKSIPKAIIRQKRTFRLIFSEENQLTSIRRSLWLDLEKLFSEKTGLAVDRSLPDVEIWFLSRSEGYGLAGLRLTKRLAGEKSLGRGELKPELAHLLCLIADLGKTDILLDPFAGSGAIPVEAAVSFSPRKIIASDKDQELFRRLQKRLARQKEVKIYNWDVLHLDSLEDGSVDKIITDPPWGFYKEKAARQIGDFYQKMLKELSRVLKTGGFLVILIGQKEIFERVLQESSLKLLGKKEILVSGKKAGIYKLKKS